MTFFPKIQLIKTSIPNMYFDRLPWSWYGVGTELVRSWYGVGMELPRSYVGAIA